EEGRKGLKRSDWRGPLGSRAERQAHIGGVCVGLEPFRRIVNDRRFGHLPMLLETPKAQGKATAAITVDPMDERNLETLRQLISRRGRGAVPQPRPPPFAYLPFLPPF